jgi:hypothetical protein
MARGIASVFPGGFPLLRPAVADPAAPGSSPPAGAIAAPHGSGPTEQGPHLDLPESGAVPRPSDEMRTAASGFGMGAEAGEADAVTESSDDDVAADSGAGEPEWTSLPSSIGRSNAWTQWADSHQGGGAVRRKVRRRNGGIWAGPGNRVSAGGRYLAGRARTRSGIAAGLGTGLMLLLLVLLSPGLFNGRGPNSPVPGVADGGPTPLVAPAVPPPSGAVDPTGAIGSATIEVNSSTTSHAASRTAAKGLTATTGPAAHPVGVTTTAGQGPTINAPDSPTPTTDAPTPPDSSATP